MAVVDGVSRPVADGRVVFPSDVRGHAIDILKPGSFLTRKTTLTSDRLAVWPSSDPAYESQVVYHVWSRNRLTYPLLDRNVTWSADPQIAGSRAAMNAIEGALAEAMRLSRGRVTFSPADTQPAILFKVDPTDPELATAAALARLRFLGRQISGADIVFKDLRLVQPVVATHEVGHFMGFGHSPDPREVMVGTFTLGTRTTFSDRLVDTWALMTQRKAGQLFEDDDRSLGAGAVVPATTIVCDGMVN
jgi:hypothetical protein